MTQENNIVEGPLGFPMAEAVAREVEAIIKTLPFDCKYKHFDNAAAVQQFDEGEHADISIITTDSIDRDGEVILQDGINWKQFEAAGSPITFAHQYKELPIGRGAWQKRKGNGWLGKTIYASKPDGMMGDWFPDSVFHLVKTGVLRGKSIGFLPLQPPRKPTQTEINTKGWASVKAVIPSCMALEWAITPVACNPDALLQAVSKGLCSRDLVMACNIEMPKPKAEFKAATYKDVQDAVMAAITSEMRNLDLRTVIADEMNRMKGRV